MSLRNGRWNSNDRSRSFRAVQLENSATSAINKGPSIAREPMFGFDSFSDPQTNCFPNPALPACLTLGSGVIFFIANVPRYNCGIRSSEAAAGLSGVQSRQLWYPEFRADRRQSTVLDHFVHQDEFRVNGVLYRRT
ncbi:hypothetical protein J6590_092591 [Homalodisca vitripennis]|nr:hypothetical protein J6590_092591 [Homalodisca vitripennis]